MYKMYYKMFNNVRRCLIVSIRIHRNLLASSFHEGVLLELSRANARCSITAACKRFYCHSTNNNKTLTSAELKFQQDKLDKQKLEEFLTDPANKKLFQILELEIDVVRHSGGRVPDNLEPKHWLMLLSLTHKARRTKYLDYIWRIEKADEHKRAKKEAKRLEWEASKEKQSQTEDTGEMKYGLLYNSLFMRIYDTTINHYYNGKIIQNMMFEPKIVFDCSYDNEMTQREIHNCAKQLSLAFASNRSHVNPMFPYFCNFNMDGMLRKYFQQNIPNIMNDDFPAVITPQSYLDIFPKDELVYLTPHCRVNLTEYDPNAVYIIGALVDKKDSRPLSLAKAKKEGIRMAKFPIDQYLKWGVSSCKSLTLDQTMKIMLDLKHTGDWKKALQNVPTRKLKPARDQLLQSKLQKYTSISSKTSNTEECKLDFTFQNRKRN